MTRTFRAPGRVNLIGEHTDYNDGFVFPAAIEFATTATASPRADRTVHARSEYFEDGFSFSLDDREAKARHAWSDYIQGVALALEQAGCELRGTNLTIRTNVPLGAGLSSSAALEVSSALALLHIAGQDLPKLELAALCQKVENEFVGMRSGIMDQFISLHGVKDHAVLLDCRSMEHHAVALPAGLTMAICNTMVKHELASSEYNNRREDCETAAMLLGVASLRDATLESLSQTELPEQVRMRALHVIQEIERTERAAEVLQHGDAALFGRFMYESHESLRDLYEVSCAELDLMVEIARKQPGVYGARMTGGGFGGCTINLMEAEHAAAFQMEVAAAFREATGVPPDIYITRAVNGANEVAP
ncbi:MAG TPA: galactokinase [Bryobacteraceae bacterium]|nr:galactokinase [Bryobacteraceae bacterium]